jgi:hypothetical protein
LHQAVQRGQQHWLKAGREMIAARYSGAADARLVEIGEGATL